MRVSDNSGRVFPKRFQPWIDKQPAQEQEKYRDLMKSDRAAGKRAIVTAMAASGDIPRVRIRQIRDLYQRATTGDGIEKLNNKQQMLITMISAAKAACLTDVQGMRMARAFIHGQPVTEDIIGKDALVRLSKTMLMETRGNNAAAGWFGIGHDLPKGKVDETLGGLIGQGLVMRQGLHDAGPALLNDLIDENEIKLALKLDKFLSNPSLYQ
jgi:hypothetical protein